MADTTPAAILRKHPAYNRYAEDEARHRATFLATRRHLVPFLVPHRFEGDLDLAPTELRRSRYGYALGLNGAYLDEIMGHIQGAPVTRRWGPLFPDGEEDVVNQPPTGGLAKALWDDATMDGTSWPNFFGGEVLEWMLSALGGVIVVDVPPGEVRTEAEARAAGKRPYVRFVPFSKVIDFAADWSWVKLAEEVDARSPTDGEVEEWVVLYELDERGNTIVTRYDDEGNQDGEAVDLGAIVDPQDRPILPVIPAVYGKHPEVGGVGAGLLFNLADIVIDLFNRLSEVNEGYRDAVFGVMVHKGPEAEKVRDALVAGSRFVTLGNNDGAGLDRLAAESNEVAAGLSLIELGLKAWALSAKRKAAEAVDSAAARSGVSLTAEFQLDLKPLLTLIAGALDQVETAVLFVAAQLAGETVAAADALAVHRATDFRLEDEASRISRIVGDYVKALPLPAEAKVQIGMRWLEASGLVDLDAEVQADGASQKVRDVAETQMRQSAEAEARSSELLAGFGSQSLADPTADPAAPPADPKAAGAAVPDTGTTVQDTALNGAQVTSLVELVMQVADGQLPVETARAIIDAAFPALTPEQINRIVGGLKGFKPAAPDAPAPARAPAAAPVKGGA